MQLYQVKQVLLEKLENNCPEFASLFCFYVFLLILSQRWYVGHICWKRHTCFTVNKEDAMSFSKGSYLLIFECYLILLRQIFLLVFYFSFFFSAFLIFCLFCILSLGYLLCFFSLMQMYVSLQIYCTGNITMSWAKTGPRITDRKV